jgi:hypothetical protein
MKTMFKGSAFATIAVAVSGLYGGTAFAETCGPVGQLPPNPNTPYTYVVFATPDAICHDYGEGNVQKDGAQANWTLSDTVLTYESGNNTLQVPTSMSFLDGDQTSGDPLEGALVMGNGTFTINAANAMNEFLVVLKQGSTWAAFLVPSGTSTFTVNGDGAFSHGLLFGSGDSYQVPIPAAAWLLGSGLLGLIGIGRRRRAAAVAA